MGRPTSGKFSERLFIQTPVMTFDISLCNYTVAFLQSFKFVYPLSPPE